MSGLLIAIVGDVNPNRTYTPPMKDPAKAKRAAEELGAELARQFSLQSFQVKRQRLYLLPLGLQIIHFRSH
jgi:hypothetical protein